LLSGGNFAVATYTVAGGTATTLRFLMWDASYNIVYDRTFSGSAYPTQLCGSTIATGNFLYRWDGASWGTITLAPRSGASYACGDDVALSTIASQETGILASYIADSAEWNTQSISAGTPENFFPTISGNFLTAGNQMYRCQSDGSWVVVGSLPLDAAPESVQNRGPQYLIFENTPRNVSDTATTVYLFKNGGIDSAATTTFASQRILTTSNVVNAPELAGARAFVTYPAGEDINSPSELYLHRVINHSVSDNQPDYVVSAVSISNGYETATTTYTYDATEAVFDTTGQIVQYPSVMQAWLDSSDAATGGTAVHTFFNGLADGASQYFSLLAGYIESVQSFNPEGMELSFTGNEWNGVALESGTASPLGVVVPAVQIVLASAPKRVSALVLFTSRPLSQPISTMLSSQLRCS